MAEVDDRGFPLKTHAVLRMGEQDTPDRTIRFHWHVVQDHERAMDLEFPHIIRIPEGVGQALLEALSRNYLGSADVQRLAADVIRERARRDTAEDRLWNILDRMTTHLSMEMNADPVALELARQSGREPDVQFVPERNESVAQKLADHIPALIMSIDRNSAPPPVGSPPLLFHEPGTPGQCGGHMPWDLKDICTFWPSG
jgi:hypothetical protein